MNAIELYRGRLISIRGASSSDYPQLWAWCADRTDRHFLNASELTGDVQGFFKYVANFEAIGNCLVLIGAPREERLIGYACAYEIDPWDRIASAAVFVEKPYRMRGHGVEAAMFLGNYLFNALGLRKLLFEVYHDASDLVDHLDSLGYAREVVLPRHRGLGSDTFSDLITFGCDRENWPTWVLPRDLSGQHDA